MRIKQYDFHIFSEYLTNTQNIKILVYNENIERYSKDLKGFEFTQEDIKQTIEYINKMENTKDDNLKEKYNIFTKEELLANLDNSIKFIEKNLND